MSLGKLGEGVAVVLISAVMFFIVLPEIKPTLTALFYLIGSLFVIGGAIQMAKGIF